MCSVRYRCSRYRYGCRTELTEVSGTGIDVVPNLPKCPVPVLMCRKYRSVRYRYESLHRYRRYRYPCRTELIEVSGTGADVVPNLPKCPVPVLMLYRLSKCPVPVWMSYRNYRSVRYQLTEVSGAGMKVCTGTGGTGIHVVPNLPKCPVPILMSCRAYRSVWYLY